MDKEVAYTALCVWEEILRIRTSKQPEVDAAFEHFGPRALRSWALVLAAHLEQDWAKDSAAWDEGPFDWEYVPQWIHDNIDWNDLQQIADLTFVPKAKPDYFHLGAEAE